MAIFRLFINAVMTLLLGVSAANAQGDLLEKYLHEEILNNIVTIHVEFAGRPAQDGMGFIVGRDGDTLWIATARHVVTRTDGNTVISASAKITVFLRNIRTEWTLRRSPVESATDPDLDFLAVFAPLTQLGGVDQWLQPGVADQPQRGERVWLAKPGEIAFDDGVASVGSTSDPRTLYLEHLKAQPAQSGGPVVTARGIIGMLLQSGAKPALAIESVEEGARLDNVAWGLRSSKLTYRSPTHLCISSTGIVHPPLGLNGERGVIRMKETGCADAFAGNYNLVIFDQHVSCLPQSISLSNVPSQALEVNCEISPQGMWQSNAYGFINVTRSVSGTHDWSFNGFELLMHGTFTGTLTGEPPYLSLSAHALDGSELSGQMLLTERSLKGTVLLDGFAIQMELGR
jgi:hypothetical protein